MFKKDWRKEFDSVKGKIDEQVQKLRKEVEKNLEEIEKVEAERAEALAELQFDSIHIADEKIQALKQVIEQKKRIISELEPKKSVALQRAAKKALDEVIKQREKRKVDSDAIQEKINVKVAELQALIRQGDEINVISAEIASASIPLLAVLQDETKHEYQKQLFNAMNGQALNVFPRMKFNKLMLDLKHYEEFKGNF